jgi:Icc-related predicted phosphoesterase
VASLGELDVLVVGGDLTTMGTPDDATRAIELWRPLAHRLLAVAGNMDSPAIDTRLAELGVSIHGRGVVVDGVGFAGASASPFTPLHTPYEIDDREFAASAARGLAQIHGCPVRILCPHAPPHGTECDRIRSGEHVGSPELRWLVEHEQPDLVLCGHIHESRGEDTIVATRIVNPGPVAAGHCAVVDVDEDELSVTLV